MRFSNEGQENPVQSMNVMGFAQELILKIDNHWKVVEEVVSKAIEGEEKTEGFVGMLNNVAKIEIFREQFGDLNRSIDSLMDESEKLIESPDAKLPETMAKRQEIKSIINNQ